MCKEDFRFAKEFRLRRISVTVPLAAGKILDGNSNRVALWFFAPPTNRYTVGPFGDVTLDNGLTMSPTNRPYLVSKKDMGGALQQQWFGASAVAGQTITVWEVEWPDDGE